MRGGNEAGGVDAVGLVEGVDGEAGEFEEVAWTRTGRDQVGFGFGLRRTGMRLLERGRHLVNVGLQGE